MAGTILAAPVHGDIKKPATFEGLLWVDSAPVQVQEVQSAGLSPRGALAHAVWEDEGSLFGKMWGARVEDEVDGSSEDMEVPDAFRGSFGPLGDVF